MTKKRNKMISKYANKSYSYEQSGYVDDPKAPTCFKNKRANNKLVCVGASQKKEEKERRDEKFQYFNNLPPNAHKLYAKGLKKRYKDLTEKQKREWHRLYMEAVRHNKIR